MSRHYKSGFTKIDSPVVVLGSELLPDGTVVEIPSNLHATAAEMSDLQFSDAQLRGVPRLGEEPNANTALDATLLSSEGRYAQRMGLTTVPQIMVTERSAGLLEVPDASSGFTKEGTPFIQLNRAALKQLSLPQIQSILALETDRLAHGDALPEHLAAGVNDQVVLLNDTFRADSDASGPKGTCDPPSLALTIQQGDAARKNALIAAGARDLRDPEHPPAEDRIARLNQQNQWQRKTGVCRPPTNNY